jgi:hypothetical protein
MFLLDGRPAQRFDYGLITFDHNGKAVFTPGAAPSTTTNMPETTGILHGEDSDPVIQRAFQSAWQAGINAGLPVLQADTPVMRIDIAGDPWFLPVQTDEAEGEAGLRIRHVYYQSFGGGSALFVMAEGTVEYSGKSAALPLYPKSVASPFLEVLLHARNRKAPGAEHLNPVPFPPGFISGKTGLGRMLLEGIALYGLPLGAEIPRQEGNSIKKSQRFSRGWLSLESPASP